MLEKPARLDRADGDVHPGGNPHIQTDPRNVLRVAGPLTARLMELDPGNAAFYQERGKAFAERFGAAIAGWEKRAATLKGTPIVVQHKAFTYLIAWLGMNEIAALEPKPGVEPTTAWLSEVLALLQRQPAKMVIRAAYQSDRASLWIAERAKINAVALPFTVGGDADAKDLYSLYRRHDRAPPEGGAMNLNAVDMSILLPAFAAGLLVTATHVPLGTQVLARGIVFIDLAIAQIAGCGVLFADQLGFEAEGAAVQIAALAAALGGALLLTWTERVFADVQEAVIGVVFVLAATGSVLLLASNVHGGEHLRDLLVGQILWAQPTRLLWVAIVYAGILALWFGVGDRLGRAGFYALFAVAVTLSVQLVGLYLVFATLIVPPLATRRMTTHRLPGRVGARRNRLCGWPAAVDVGRPAERTDDRVGAGSAGDRRRVIQPQRHGRAGCAFAPLKRGGILGVRPEPNLTECCRGPRLDESGNCLCPRWRRRCLAPARHSPSDSLAMCRR